VLQASAGGAGPRSSTIAPRAALILTATLIVAVAALSALSVWQGYRDTLLTARARAEGAAQVIAAHTSWLVEASRQALLRIDETVSERPDDLLGGTAGDLDAAVEGLPVEVVAWVIDSNGRSVLSTDPDLQSIDASDRDYFKALRDGEAWVISPLIRGKATNRQVFVIGRRIERDGRFAGAALISVPSTLVADFWRTMTLGPGSTSSIVRDDGWLVARFPVPEEGINLKNQVLFTQNLAFRPAGSYTTVSPVDGVARIVGFHTIPDLPLIAVAGLSQDEVLANFWSNTAIAAAIAVPIALALLAVAAWVTVLLRRDESQRAALAAALEENNVLFREIHHRVKNNLQTVASLVRLQDIPPSTKRELTARILAMTAVHEQLYLSDNFGELDLSAYVADLVAKLKASNVANVTVAQTLDPIEVDTDRAIPLGLVINEVVQNAFKHAFPGDRAGAIEISLQRSGTNQARLVIRDDGTGYDPETAKRTGMGSRLIEALSKQIGAATSVVRDGGTVFTMTFPLSGPLMARG
jgi:two-component sensor histidine kinase